MAFDWSSIVARSGSTTRMDEIHRFEQDVGFDLPADYKEFLLNLNGGEVTVEHDISIPGVPFELGVNYLLPLSAKTPFVGIIEARRIQAANRLCSRHVIEIADDGGTGFYY